MLSKKLVLCSCLALLLILALPCPPVQAQMPDFTVLEITDTLDKGTIGLANAGDGSGRLFVVVQTGEIQIWNGTQVLATPFLDIDALTNGGGEQGLLGLAFHPNYTSNGFFYVYYTDLAGDTVVARYSVSADPNVADGGSALRILGFNQTAGNHNGGDMHFGPDGYLYIASGDGGGNWCDSQDDGNLRGKMLRIDVDGDDFPGDPDANYAIPPDNPLVGVSGASEEIWAMGLRNPWRFSIDRANGDVLIGDVGEGAWEEFSRLPAGVGGLNLGWPWFEGEATFTNCAEPSGGPFAACDDAPFSCPFALLGRVADGACSAIGGYRYRGVDYPGLTGLYFYTDWCGGIVKAAREEGATWNSYDVSDQGFGVTGFGEDDNGEVYFVNGPTLYQITGEGFGLFTDGFESGDVSMWSSTTP